MTVVPIKSLPLGFRFHPTDEELVNHYLKRKINGRIRSEMEVIPEIDVCKCEPWDLPGRALIESDDPEWFFFSPKDRKYPNGHRSNRATEAGYWKATGKDRYIRSKAPSAIIGMKKTLVFHRGRAPRGIRTNWIMHEYRTTEPEFDSGEQGGYVLYRLFRKPEESAPIYNVDEMDRSDLSITPSKSSPSETQNEVDVFEEHQTPAMLQWNQVSPVSDIQENTKFQIAVDKYNDNNSLNLKDGYNNNLEQRELVDPLLEALGQMDSNGIPDIPSPPLCAIVDHSFPCNGNQESNTGLFQANFNEPDSMDALLNSFFSNEDESTCGNEGIGYNDPEWFYMDASNDYSERTLPENTVFHQSYDDYSVDSGSESLHDLFNNMNESKAQFNFSNHENNLEENGITGIKIRSRQPRSVVPNNMPAQQGFATRRLRLQVSTVEAEQMFKPGDNEEICETEQVENNVKEYVQGGIIDIAPLSLEESKPNLRLRAKAPVETNIKDEHKYVVFEMEEIKHPVTYNYVMFMAVMIMIVVLLLVGIWMWKRYRGMWVSEQ